jgi:signal transduction histidine kinase
VPADARREQPGVGGGRPAIWRGLRRLLTRRLVRAENHRLRELEAARTSAMQFVGHEIRTPLAVVRGYLSMIRDGTLGPVSQEAAAALAEVDVRLIDIEDLAAQLTEAARMADAGLRLHLEPIDLRTPVTEAVERSRSARGGTAVELRGLDRPVPVVADLSRLRMVIANLIDNALKYSPGGARVTCTVEVDGPGVRVLVSDRGIGLDPGQVDQLFQPYSRLARTDAPARPGLGLGLYLAREIARAHGGELDAWPNSDAGSTFRLTLPAAQQWA